MTDRIMVTLGILTFCAGAWSVVVSLIAGAVFMHFFGVWTGGSVLIIFFGLMMVVAAPMFPSNHTWSD